MQIHALDDLLAKVGIRASALSKQNEKKTSRNYCVPLNLRDCYPTQLVQSRPLKCSSHPGFINSIKNDASCRFHRSMLLSTDRLFHFLGSMRKRFKFKRIKSRPHGSACKVEAFSRAAQHSS